MVASRSDPRATEGELPHGIPIFLDQLIATLTIEETPTPPPRDRTVGIPRSEVASGVVETAGLHGRDLFNKGFTIEQVVRDYGDVCQAVTNLAFESGAAISVDEFRTFNRCLDNAIAGAVTEYAKHSTAASEQTISLRLGPLAQELRNHLHTAILSVTAMKSGSVGNGGATATALDESLMAMRIILDRSLT